MFRVWQCKLLTVSDFKVDSLGKKEATWVVRVIPSIMIQGRLA